MSLLHAVALAYVNIAVRLRKLGWLMHSAYHGRKMGGANLHLETPCEITNHRYIRTAGFSARAGLRINLFTEHFHPLGIPKLEIGEGVRFEANVHIGVIDEVVIERGVLVGSNVIIMDHNHGSYSDGPSEEELVVPPFYRKLSSNGPIRIGENAWIGDGAVILAGARIGKGAVIGAHAVVTGVVPDHSVVAGPRGRVIKLYGRENRCWRRVDGTSGRPSEPEAGR